MGIINTTNASRAVKDVIAERLSQTIDHGRKIEHDDEYVNGALADYAAVYALNPEARKLAVSIPARGIYAASTSAAEYAFVPDGFSHPNLSIPRREQLVRAAALLIAEIERIDRACRVWVNRPVTSVEVGDTIFFNGRPQTVRGLQSVDYGDLRILLYLSDSGSTYFYMSDYVSVSNR